MRTSSLLGFFAVVLCAATTACGAADAATDTTGESTEALTAGTTARPSLLVDRYADPTAGIRKLVGLELGADGKYTSQVNVSDIAFCRTLPCLEPQAGTWAASAIPGACSTFRLRLVPEAGEVRTYTARVDAATGGLVLTDANGATQTLAIAPAIAAELPTAQPVAP